LEKRGVTIVLGEREPITNDGEPFWSPRAAAHADRGRALPCDVLLWCVGHRANGGVVGGGVIAADANLLVKSFANVYTSGDCLQSGEEKTASAADLAAMVAAVNGARALKRGDNPKLLAFPRDACAGAAHVPVVACVNLFKHSGVRQFKSVVICGAVAALTKAVIEAAQLTLARERACVFWLWRLFETLMLAVCRVL